MFLIGVLLTLVGVLQIRAKIQQFAELGLCQPECGQISGRRAGAGALSRPAAVGSHLSAAKSATHAGKDWPSAGSDYFARPAAMSMPR